MSRTRPARAALRAARRNQQRINRSRKLFVFESLELRMMLSADTSLAELPLPAVGSSEIQGLKWSDFNGDGNRDSNEPGLAGVTIYLDANDSGALDDGESSTVTDSAGNYAFTGLMPGNYIVREVSPPGYTLTYPLQPASEFDITIVFPDNTLTAEQKAVFTEAAARWEQIIIGDLPAINLPGFGLVDDIVIEASGPAIDGPGNILGQAGPEFIRTAGFLPISGAMRFDSADITELMNDGQFDEVILHEMGHVLGIGTIWDLKNLLVNNNTPNVGFIGARAVAEYNSIFGLNATAVPVEGDQGGGGTLYSHWDESTFNNEIMTGFLNSGENPLSRITVAQLRDLGYEVYLNAADEYAPPAQATTQQSAAQQVVAAVRDGWVAPLGRPFQMLEAAGEAEPVSAQGHLSRANLGFWTIELADAEAALDINFGNRPLPSSLSGTKWNDRNGDGVRGEDEPALANWTIFLDDDGDGAFDEGERLTTTNAAGRYVFSNLAPGEYVIAEVQKDGWVQTHPASGAYEISLLPGVDVTDLDFGNRQGYIAGKVWNDYLEDGLQSTREPSLAGWTVFLDANGNGVLNSGPSTTASTGATVAIPDAGTLTSQLTLGNLGVIEDLDVALNIRHTYDGDLDVFLISPAGTRIELFTDVGANGDNFTGTILDDEAIAVIGSGKAPFTGRFRPEGSLNVFDGENAQGVWKLEVSDDSATDLGELVSWSITVTTSEKSTLTDAEGNYVLGDLLAGAYAVALVVPTGWELTHPTPAPAYDVTLAVGEAFNGASFGARTGAIGGQVWNDANSNGLIDPFEDRAGQWLVYLDKNANNAYDDGVVTLASTGPTRNIPDLGKLNSAINVGGLFAIDDINVSVTIQHTDLADLDVFLISPSGSRVELFTDLAGGGQNLAGTVLDDEATLSIVAGSGPFAGAYKPEGSLAVFDGEDPNGVWTLEITDDAGNDVGKLLSWSLSIDSHEPVVETDSEGSYIFRDLLPGSYGVRTVLKPNWAQTAPSTPGTYSIALGPAEQSYAAEFGVKPTILFGDYDRDGVISGNDFLAWQRGLGATNLAPNAGADGDGDTDVDADDLIFWEGEFIDLPVTAIAAAVVPLDDETSVGALDLAFSSIDPAALAGPTAYAPSIRAAINAARPRFRPQEPASLVTPRTASSDARTLTASWSGPSLTEAEAQDELSNEEGLAVDLS
jgi:subtilisin-like proprotein convertase family protein